MPIFASTRLPQLMGTPASDAIISLRRNGTPANGPADGAAAAARADSKVSETMALIGGLRISMREIASSTNSLDLTSLLRTSSARPNPS
jgi:hypothetical protein